MEATKAREIECAPSLLEPGWAQFAVKSFGDGTPRKAPVVVWVTVVKKPMKGSHCECKSGHILHGTSSTWLQKTWGVSHSLEGHAVCHHQGHFVE